RHAPGTGGLGPCPEDADDPDPEAGGRVGPLPDGDVREGRESGRHADRPGALPEARETHLSRFMYGIQVTDEKGERSAFSVPIEIEVVEPPPPAKGLR